MIFTLATQFHFYLPCYLPCLGACLMSRLISVLHVKVASSCYQQGEGLLRYCETYSFTTLEVFLCVYALLPHKNKINSMDLTKSGLSSVYCIVRKE